MYNFRGKKRAWACESSRFIRAARNIDFLHKKVDGLLTVYFVQIGEAETVQMYQKIGEKCDFAKFSLFLRFKYIQKQDYIDYFARFLKIEGNFLLNSAVISK